MDVLSRPVLPPDHRIAYGSDADQFGHLWLPQTRAGARAPLVVFFHGGWWKSEYDLGYAGYLCRAFKQAGIATWSVEYRRVTPTSSGWPILFQDVAAGFDYVATLAKTYPLDLSRVITVGHSAGGHLAFWTAGRHHVDAKGGLAIPPPAVPLLGTIALAGAVDLALTIELSRHAFMRDQYNVFALLGGTQQEVPARYRVADPGGLLPFSVPQILLQGTDDDQIPPELPARWVVKARHLGDKAEAVILPGADHFDVVDPDSHAWPSVMKAVRGLLPLH